MRIKLLLRILLAIVLAIFGAYLARFVISPSIFGIGAAFVIVGIFAFGILGFILPEILEFATKAGITTLAAQIARHLPDITNIPNPGSLSVGTLPFSKKRKRVKNEKGALVIDTSVLIDGRVLQVAKAGFIYGRVFILPAVIDELHKLSDSADDLKRAKGRRGLDNLNELKEVDGVKIEVPSWEPKDDAVDAKLVSFTKQIKGRLMTVDFNLNKVARAKNVQVLNLNDLASALRASVLPKQRLAITVNNVGKEKSQGVGYLEDGTMVVVEQGAGFVGKQVEVTVSKVLQTSAGKMIFARIEN